LNLNFIQMLILFYCFLILNFCAFLITAYDKYLAIKKKKRISEKTLLSFAAVGGILGSGLGMLTFRHKTSKTSFLWKFFTIAVVQVLIVYTLLYFEIISLIG
jgi:uncharacterized membrane protein YsdA (DUF1294 family)